MGDRRTISHERSIANVPSQTFDPRADLDMLFAAIDVIEGRLLQAFLVPAPSSPPAPGSATSAAGSGSLRR